LPFFQPFSIAGNVLQAATVRGVDILHGLSNQCGRRTLFNFNDPNILIIIRDFIEQRSTDLESWSLEFQIHVCDAPFEQYSNILRDFQ